MNLRSLKNDLAYKEAGLKNANIVLKTFLKAKKPDKSAIAEVREIIKQLEDQIVDIKKAIKELEKRGTKK